jgi:transposase-like protein
MQLREFPFETKIFDRYSRTEKALVNAITESFLQSASTNKFEMVISHLDLCQISPSNVSKVAQELDEQVRLFLERPIDSHIPYLINDALYFKVKHGIQYINKALIVVAGVREDGYRQILGARIADAKMNLPGEGSSPTSRNEVSIR